MLLSRGESLIIQESSRLISSGGVGGTLILTNQRLVFEAKTGGGLLAGNSGVTVVNLELERIWNLHASVARFDVPGLSRHTLTVESSAGRHSFGVADPARWGNAIGEARAARPAIPPPPPPPPPPQSFPPPPPHGSGSPVIVHVLTSQPPPAAPSVPAIMIRCRYCGAISPPTLSKCPSCGASI
ncbi:MAG: hypothetical protein L3K19_01505 [Thermoplasmata archaeon]|nr:hypothetical protein [Thermoplasmata archaeon]